MTTTPGRRRLWVVLATSLGSGAVLMGAAPSSAPSPTSWAGWEEWYAVVGPGPVIVALAWLVAVLLAGWLTAACALQLIAGLSCRGPWRVLADRIAPTALRGIATASLSAGLTLSTSAGAGADNAPGTATLHPIGAEEVPTTSPSAVPTPVLAPSERSTDGSPDEYTVVRGDSFWTIALDRLAEMAPDAQHALQHPDYWRLLIAANADRLVDAGNPDLLYAGQVLVLPPLT